MELELFILLLFHIFGTAIFGKFESETPWWKLVLKWVIILPIVWVCFRWMGHYSLLVILFLGAVGLTVHFIWCRKNGIDPLQATPRKKYYELRKWKWQE